MKKTTMGGAVILAMMTWLGAGAELSAQQERAPGARAEARMDRLGRMDRTARGSGAPGVEAVLRLRDRLELSDDQVARLDALRSERVAEGATVASEMAELRSQLRAGTLDRAQAREIMRVAAEARRASAEETRIEVEGLLTEQQRATVEQLQAQRRAFEAGRRSAVRDGERARGVRPERDRPSRSRGWRGSGGSR